MEKIAVVGIGWYGFSPHVHDLSFREMVFEASSRAYYDAGGMDPRRDVDTFISCQEDFWEGISIADEFSPDPLGGSMRPTMTVAGDGLQGVAHGVMQINAGLADVVVVESHAKPSDIITFADVVRFSADPLYVRKANVPNVHFLAALDATKFLSQGKATRADMAEVVEKNKNAGLSNPRSSYASRVDKDYILSQDYVLTPFTRLDIAQPVDAAVVVVLASETVARRYTDTPIWIHGIGFATDSSNLELASLGEANYMKLAAEMAYKEAKVETPLKFKGIFVDDRYSHKELEHLEALGIKDVTQKLREGYFHPGSYLPVNPGGGLLAKGYPLEASGLALLLDAVEHMRQGQDSAIVGSWRGFYTFTGAVAVMSR